MRQLRVAVTGCHGQVVRSLTERADANAAQVIPLGRPELDLERPDTIAKAIEAVKPDVVVSAAAYTAVDLAESEPATASLINEIGAAHVARVAALLSVPIVHLSTDYVFDGAKIGPYCEDDPTGPTGVYGRTKLAGEQALRLAHPNYAILRTAWVYSPFGKNFVRTMLAIAAKQDMISVVDDQIGNPTAALDIADGVLTVARNLAERAGEAQLRGVFHMAGEGNATWAEFARAIFETSRQAGGPFADVKAISTAEYPTPARRPANSQLNCTKLATLHGVRLPHWRGSLSQCVARLVPSEFAR